MANFKWMSVEDMKYDISLVLAILKGEREKIIDATPIKYSNLYRYTGNNYILCQLISHIFK